MTQAPSAAAMPAKMQITALPIAKETCILATLEASSNNMDAPINAIIAVLIPCCQGVTLVPLTEGTSPN